MNIFFFPWARLENVKVIIFCDFKFLNQVFAYLSQFSNLLTLAPLRALYLGDNEFERLSPEIKNLVNLQVVS